ncbi:MAG: ROK family transcriptional regulator [Muribaculum sp.]|nr:ROK family transcriptional regulator [Muribaculum sp.]
MTVPFLPDSERGYNKKRIITSFFHSTNLTIPELSKEINLSIPTVTKFVNEMVDEGLLIDYGKSDSKAGRKPNTFGLNPQAGFFLGIDIKKNHINLGLCNFNGETVQQDLDIPYSAQATPSDDINEVCNIANDFLSTTGIDHSKILNACVNISGRVNPNTGFSFSNFVFSETPVSEIISEKLGIPACIENDTRAMTYGESIRGSINGEANILYINLGWGLGLGMIINGTLYEGKSGFAGEFGHIHAFDNELMCHCGKKGCLETEVSGYALHREIVESIKGGKVSVLSKYIEKGEPITLNDIVEAINAEDFLCIDLLEEIGEKLGKQLANIINIFNPELVVIGGTLSAAGEYLIQPVRQAVKKHSLKLVNSDTKIICSRLHEKAGIIGACMTARRHMFEKA